MVRFEIKDIFFIKDRETIMVHLLDDNWDFKNLGPVYLYYGKQKIRMQYVGFSDMKGKPVLLLKLDDNRYDSIGTIEEIVNKNKTDIFLRR